MKWNFNFKKLSINKKDNETEVVTEKCFTNSSLNNSKKKKKKKNKHSIKLLKPSLFCKIFKSGYLVNNYKQRRFYNSKRNIMSPFKGGVQLS